MNIGLAVLERPGVRVPGLLLVGLLWISASAAQTLEFRHAITQQTNLAGVTHAAWSPDGAHLYAVADQDHTLIQFIPAVDGSLAFGQVLRDGANGVDGLEGAIAVALSPGGEHVYVASTVDDAVAVFSRDGGSGELSFVEAVKDGVGGVDGLDGATFVAVSPDGAHVYVAGGDDDAVAALSRDGITGQLSFVQAFRRLSDMNAPRQLAISPDGATVYAVAPTSDSLLVLDRDDTTGMLSFVEFFENTGLFGTPEPNEIDGLFQVGTVAVSPDGANVYVASSFDDTILGFDRAGDGTLTHAQTLDDGVDGVDGLNGAVYVSVSPDGANVYVAARVDDAVTTFDRDGLTGALGFAATQPGGVEGLNFVDSAIVSPDGTLVHGISGSDRTLVAFTRDTGTGALALSAVREEPAGDVVGLSQVRSLAVDTGGTRIYTAGAQDNAIGVFALDPGNQTLRFVEAQRNGVEGVHGLTEVNDVVVSPDRRFVYAVSPVDNVVAIFSVVGFDGELKFQKTTPHAGTTFGMDGASALAMSADGRHLYVAGAHDSSIVVFARDPETGHLIRVETLTNGENGITGLSSPESIAISPDGTVVLVASAFSTEVVVFSRDHETGRLLHEPVASTKGFGSAARRVVFTPDGLHFFVITESPQLLLVFSIDLLSGTPVLTEIQRIEDTGTGITISEDGTTVTVTDADTSSVQVYARDPESGLITLMDTATHGQDGVTGVADPAPIVDPDDSLADVILGDRDGSLALFATAALPVPGPVDVSITKVRGSEPAPGQIIFYLRVENKRSDSSTQVFVEDLLPLGAIGGQWEVLSATRSSLSAGQTGEGDLRLGFQLDPSESSPDPLGNEQAAVLFKYTIQTPASRSYFNRATVTAEGDINERDNVSGARSKPDPVLIDGFESIDFFGQGGGSGGR